MLSPTTSREPQQAYSIPTEQLEQSPVGVLHTSNGSRQVNRQNFSPFQKTLLKGLFGFSVVNLAIAGSIVGYAAVSKQEASGWSMPFFANALLGLFSFIIAKNVQLTDQEESTPLLSS